MRNLMIVAAVVLMTGSALAERISQPKDSVQALNLNYIGPRAPYTEDFETFTTGALVPQGGWDSEWAANASVVNPGISGNSAKHTSDGTVIAGFELISPAFSGTYGVVAADVQVNALASLYQFCTADVVTGYFNTRVNFELDGSITVGQVNAAQTGYDFLPASEGWTQGEVFQFGIATDSAGVLQVYKNGVVIFTGTDTSFDLGFGAGIAGQWLGWTDNAGGTTNSMLVDNFTDQLVPEPTSLLLLGLGAVSFLRRR